MDDPHEYIKMDLCIVPKRASCRALEVAQSHTGTFLERTGQPVQINRGVRGLREPFIIMNTLEYLVYSHTLLFLSDRPGWKRKLMKNCKADAYLYIYSR